MCRYILSGDQCWTLGVSTLICVLKVCLLTTRFDAFYSSHRFYDYFILREILAGNFTLLWGNFEFFNFFKGYK